MSETRKRCPNGEKYNKETNSCEPKGEMSKRVSKTRTTTAKSTSPRTTTAKSTSPRSKTPKSASSKSASSKSASSKSASSKSASPKANLSSSTVDTFILHEHSYSYRLLVSIPVNNDALWPNPNICYFRTSGRSNKNSEIFTGSWFPIAGIKDSSTMPEYLEDKRDGFLIKMAFIMNNTDELSETDKKPKWICDLVSDYPIVLEEHEKDLFDGKRSTITIKEFIEKNKYEKNKTSKIIDTNYERIAKEIEKVLNDGFRRFLNYFLYEWQAMLSLRIGGGYWKLNPVFTEYISRKLSRFDLVPVPHINPALKEIDEKELKIIYESDPNNDKETNSGQSTIDFSKRAGTQLSMMQITAIRNEEEEKLKSTAGKSTSQVFKISEMQTKYMTPIMQYLESVERLRRFNARFGSKI